MTKRDLVVRISEETGLVQQDVLNVVQKTLDYISDAVTKGQKVELRNFGVFEVRCARRAWAGTQMRQKQMCRSRRAPW